MNQQLWAIVIIGAYFLFFITGVMGTALFIAKRRGERPPLDIKFLRGPGESLRKRMNDFSENYFFQIGAAAVAPVFATSLILSFVLWVAPTTSPLVRFLTIVVVFFATLWLSGRWAYKRFMRFRDDRLGYLGERIVGEALLPLVAAGYQIFHDVPSKAGGYDFNVDHVAVGPNGVFAIETKTRRKGRARPGFEYQKVAYDGKQLIWPWGEDDFGLQNATDRARALTGWLKKISGLRLSAQPVLVFPGWFVSSIPHGTVIVTMEKLLEREILRAKGQTLSEDEIDRLARLLDERCRDVEN